MVSLAASPTPVRVIAGLRSPFGAYNRTSEWSWAHVGICSGPAKCQGDMKTRFHHSNEVMM